MNRLMIVEDEPAIQNGILQMVTTLRMPLDVVGCFFNGKAALERIADLSPDIILTDIRMPLVNGLELIERSREIRPDLEYIILSGYRDFEYARMAMRYDVSEYLLKPIQPRELRIALEEICRRIEEKTKDREHLRVSHLIRDPASIVPVPASPHGDDSNNYLALACAGPFSACSLDFVQPRSACWDSMVLEESLNERLHGFGRCSVADSRVSNEKAIVFSAHRQDAGSVRRFLKALCESQEKLGMPLTVVMSSPFSDMDSIHATYNSLRKTLGRSVIIGENRVVVQENAEAAGDFVAISAYERSKLRHLLDLGDTEGVIKQFTVLADSWHNEKLPQIICEYSTKFLLIEIYNAFPSVSGLLSLESLISEVESSLCTSMTFAQFTEKIVAVIERVRKATWQVKKEFTIDEVVEQLYGYIRENYTQAIPYWEFASKFGYNENYISNTFTKLKGLSPNKLVTNLRITKAKQLLRAETSSVKDIAAVTGYNDVFYFSRQFKKVAGISPKVYRERGT